MLDLEELNEDLVTFLNFDLALLRLANVPNG